jgi:hypothetical protein
MSAPLLIVLVCLATARVTRLLVADAFPPIAIARSWAAARGDWQDYLTSCPWCMGVWVAGIITALTAWRYDLPAPLLVWPTAAYAAGWIVGQETHEAKGD